jgi:biopolymer transport protein ExbD
MKLPIKATDSKVSFSIRMTPLIDVIFLLLIFFIITIQFVKPESVLENRLPERKAQGFQDQQNDWEMVRLRIKLVIKQEEQPRIYLQDRVVKTYEELLYYLNQLPKDILLVIEPESKILYKHVIGVYNACIKSKKTNIVFAISRE